MWYVGENGECSVDDQGSGWIMFLARFIYNGFDVPTECLFF